jgi:HSP20 family protein
MKEVVKMVSKLSRVEPLPVVALSRELDRLWRQTFPAPAPTGSVTASDGVFAPALDVEETEDAYRVHVELPGVAATDVEVSLADGVLRVAGERRFDADEARDRFLRLERRFGRFSRAVRLPGRLDAERVSASARDGVVTVEVPKAAEVRARRIEVKAR